MAIFTSQLRNIISEPLGTELELNPGFLIRGPGSLPCPRLPQPPRGSARAVFSTPSCQLKFHRGAWFLGKAGKNPPCWFSAGSQRPSLPPIGKATVFVVVSKGVPEAQRDADIIYHVSGAFQHLGQARKSGTRRQQFWGPLCASSG